MLCALQLVHVRILRVVHVVVGALARAQYVAHHLRSFHYHLAQVLEIKCGD